MLNQKLKNHTIILASVSPRRQQFFKDLGLDFEIRLKPLEEIYPNHLKHSEISDYLAQLKATPFINDLTESDILITSDTIVWHNNEAIGKPKDNQDAFDIVSALSGKTHEVISSVCFTTKTNQTVIHSITKVTFKILSDDEIWFYVNNFNPLDKAGAYAIQEWIGYIGVTKIEGSFFNVMGLPIHLVYKMLNDIANT